VTPHGGENALPAPGGPAEACRMRTVNGRTVFETDVG
jgi:hypothetical protein